MIYSKCCYIWLHFYRPWKEKNACWIRWCSYSLYQANWVMLTSQTLITWGRVKDYIKLFHLLEHKSVEIIFMCLSIFSMPYKSYGRKSLQHTPHGKTCGYMTHNGSSSGNTEDRGVSDNIYIIFPPHSEQSNYYLLLTTHNHIKVSCHGNGDFQSALSHFLSHGRWRY